MIGAGGMSASFDFAPLRSGRTGIRTHGETHEDRDNGNGDNGNGRDRARESILHVSLVQGFPGGRTEVS